MIKLLGKLPKQITVACSGGIDSMVLLDFLSRKHDVTAAYFDHGTEHGVQALEFVKSYCQDKHINFEYSKIKSTKEKTQSQEEYWRNERYQFFKTLGSVVTAHHLDDAVETWIWSSLNGTSSLIPYSHGNIVRPLLISRKKDIEYWAEKNAVPYIQDPSNSDVKYMRNYIRKELMPHALKVNPGLHTLLRKKIIARHLTSS